MINDRAEILAAAGLVGAVVSWVATGARLRRDVLGAVERRRIYGYWTFVR